MKWITIDCASASGEAPWEVLVVPAARWHPQPEGAAAAAPSVITRPAAHYGSENSWVCGFRCGSRNAFRTDLSVNRNTFRPFVISDS
jgi:hypothetical protein